MTNANENISGVDPLAIAGGDVDTSYPLLPGDKMMEFEICEAENVGKKDDETVRMIVYKLKTVADCLGTKRETIYAGHKVTNRITVTPNGDRTIEMVIKDLGSLSQAVFGKGNKVLLSDLRDRPADFLVGKRVVGKTILNKEKDGFGPSNSVRLVIQD